VDKAGRSAAMNQAFRLTGFKALILLVSPDGIEPSTY
jgi:hypothetical protein